MSEQTVQLAAAATLVKFLLSGKNMPSGASHVIHSERCQAFVTKYGGGYNSQMAAALHPVAGYTGFAHRIEPTFGRAIWKLVAQLTTPYDDNFKEFRRVNNQLATERCQVFCLLQIADTVAMLRTLIPQDCCYVEKEPVSMEDAIAYAELLLVSYALNPRMTTSPEYAEVRHEDAMRELRSEIEYAKSL